jgi:hypothetical protein
MQLLRLAAVMAVAAIGTEDGERQGEDDTSA